jgi:hypothetical protein
VDLLTPSGIRETKVAGDLVFQMCPASRLVENVVVEQRRRHKGILVPLISGPHLLNDLRFVTVKRASQCQPGIIRSANARERFTVKFALATGTEIRKLGCRSHCPDVYRSS